VLLIPREAVLDNEGKKIVYVLISGEEFERREVVVGDEYGRQVAILSGVQPGERVVTQGAYQLKLQELRPANAGEHSHEV
jgi:multidrug efflux pump subunit AcrA (membrane-fusion protein)